MPPFIVLISAPLPTRLAYFTVCILSYSAFWADVCCLSTAVDSNAFNIFNCDNTIPINYYFVKYYYELFDIFNSCSTFSDKNIFISDWYGTSYLFANCLMRASKKEGNRSEIDSVEGLRFGNTAF